MATDDFSRSRLDQMIDLRHPLAVLAQRMPWQRIEAALAPALAHKNRAGTLVDDVDLFGPSAQLVGSGVSAAGHPRLSIRLMASLLYLKHAFNLSDEEVVERWAENVVWHEHRRRRRRVLRNGSPGQPGAEATTSAPDAFRQSERVQVSGGLRPLE